MSTIRFTDGGKYDFNPFRSFRPKCKILTFRNGFTFVFITKSYLQSSHDLASADLIHCCRQVWCTNFRLPQHRHGVMSGRPSSASQWQIRQISERDDVMEARESHWSLRIGGGLWRARSNVSWKNRDAMNASKTLPDTKNRAERTLRPSHRCFANTTTINQRFVLKPHFWVPEIEKSVMFPSCEQTFSNKTYTIEFSIHRFNTSIKQFYILISFLSSMTGNWKIWHCNHDI